jgi:hypothetical protein
MLYLPALDARLQISASTPSRTHLQLCCNSESIRRGVQSGRVDMGNYLQNLSTISCDHVKSFRSEVSSTNFPLQSKLLVTL